VSRAVHESTSRRRIIPAAGALAAALALAGCGAGQVTQTDSVLPAVNGALGQVGPIVIRDAVFAYPSGGVYPSGGQAALVLTIVNTGAEPDELVEVSSPVAGRVEVSGDRMLLPRRAIAVGTPGEVANPTSSAVTTTPTPTSTPPASAPGSPTSPTSPTSVPASVSPSPTTTTTPAPTTTQAAELGTATIVLTGLNEALVPGKTYPVTFVFRNAGTVTIGLPLASPTTARPEPSGEGGHG
jgi:copper(I)-binding protein